MKFSFPPPPPKLTKKVPRGIFSFPFANNVGTGVFPCAKNAEIKIANRLSGDKVQEIARENGLGGDY